MIKKLTFAIRVLIVALFLCDSPQVFAETIALKAKSYKSKSNLPISTDISPQMFAEEKIDLKKYSPDGRKYEFTRDFISGLGYFKLVSDRHIKEGANAKYYTNRRDMITAFADNLFLDNTDLRIARNYVRKYTQTNNAFINKATEMYINVCISIIAINLEERKLLKDFNANKRIEEVTNREWNQFLLQQKDLSLKRKDALANLLGAAMIVGKALVSERIDEEGFSTFLSLTVRQKRDLISKINRISKEDIASGVQSGQSYVEASLAAILQPISDPRFSLSR